MQRAKKPLLLRVGRAIGAAAAAVVLGISPAMVQAQTTLYSTSTPGTWTYTIPSTFSAGYVTVTVSGGGGGGATGDGGQAGGNGGSGASVTAIVKVSPNDVLSGTVAGGGAGAIGGQAGIGYGTVAAGGSGVGAGGSGGSQGTNGGSGFGGGGGGGSVLTVNGTVLQAGGGGGGGGGSNGVSTAGSGVSGGSGGVITNSSLCGQNMAGANGSTVASGGDGGGGGGGGGGFTSGAGGSNGSDNNFVASGGGAGGSCYYSGGTNPISGTPVASSSGGSGGAGNVVNTSSANAGGPGSVSIVAGFNYWDGSATSSNNTVDGGSGTWNAAGTNWTTYNGSPNGTWPGGANTAVFQGAYGTATLASGYSASIGGLTFSTSGYTIGANSGGSLSLAGTTNTITTPSGGQATISAPISGGAGNSVLVNGAGTLYLSGTNSYTGATTVSAGTLVMAGGAASAYASGSYSLQSGALMRFDSNNVFGSDGATIGTTFDVNGSTLASKATYNKLNTLSLTNGTLACNGGSDGNFGCFGLSGAVAASGTSQISTNGAAFSTVQLGNSVSATPATTFNVTNTFTVNATLANNVLMPGGSSGLTKSGAGSMVLNAANTYTGATTITAGTLQIGGSGSLGSGSYSGAISNAGTFQYSSSAAQTLSGAIGGAGALIKDTGSSTLTLTTTNNYTGATTISAGTLVAANANALGATSTGTTVSSGGSLALSGGISVAEPLNLSGTGSGGTGALNNASGSNTASGAITLGSAATITNNVASTTLTVSGNVTNGGNDLTLDGSSPLAISGSLGGSGGLVKNGSGTATLSGSANAYTGATTVNAGTLRAGVANTAFGSNSAVTVNGSGTLDLSTYDETIGSLSGSGNVISSSPSAFLTVGGNNASTTFTGTITGSMLAFAKQGTGTLTLSGNNNFPGVININGGTLQFGGASSMGSMNGGSGMNNNGTLQYSSSADQLWIGAIVGSGSVIKDTANSSLTLTNSYSNYAGPTTISAGTLYINAPLSAVTGQVTVNGSGTLGGSGTVGGATTVYSGGTLSPGGAALGTAAGIGTLSFSKSLTLQSGSFTNIELGQVGTGSLNDLVAVTGNLTLGGTLTVTKSSGGTIGPGTYRLFTYSGSLTGSFTTVTPPTGYTAVVDTSTGGQVNLVVTAIPRNFWDGSNTTSNNVIDGGAGTWDGTTTNWTTADGSFNGTWLGGTAIANFGGTASTVTVSGSPSIGGLNFTTSGYQITGGTSLTLAQSTGNPITTPTGGNATIATPISGSYPLSFSGGTATLSGSSTSYSAAITVNTGATLVAANANALGTTSGSVTVNSGASLGLSGGINTVAKPLTLNGTGVGSAGALYNAAGTNIYSGAITLGSAASIANNVATTTLTTGGTINNAGFDLTLDGSATLSIQGGISGGGGISKTGSGTANLSSSSNSYTGATTVNAGTLQYGSTSAIPRASAVTVYSGATLDVNSMVLANSRTANTAVDGTLALGTNAQMNLGPNTQNRIANITGTGVITIESGATLTLTGNIANQGVNFILSGGTLVIPAGNVSSVGYVTLTAASTIDFSNGNGQFTTTSLTPNSWALNVANWTSGTSHLYATAVAGPPAKNTPNVAPLKQITLGSNAPAQTYWSSAAATNNELLAGPAASSYTYWDGANTTANGTADGGAGTWDSTTNNWTTVDGSFNGPWAGGGSTANFPGVAATVTVGTNQSAAGLNFGASGYTLTGASNSTTLQFTQPATITTPAGGIATLALLISGNSALTIKGGKTVVDNSNIGNNPFSGSISVNTGALQLKSNGSAAIFNSVPSINLDPNTTLELNFSGSNGASQMISGGGGVTAVGTGLHGLMAANVYTGPTKVNSGRLVAYTTNAFGSNSAVTVQSGAMLDLSYYAQAIGSLAGAGSVQSTISAAVTLTTGGDNTSTNFSGIISSAIGLTKNGTGTQTLSGANTYSGTTTVNAGTLALGANNALPTASAVTVNTGGTLSLGGFSQTLSGGLTVYSGGTLDLGTGGNLTLSAGASNIAAITGSGTITLSGAATLTLPANINNSGVNITLNTANTGGGLYLGGGTTSVLGTITLNGSSTVDLANGGAVNLTATKLTITGGTLTAANWTAGTDHFYALDITGAPARNTTGVTPLSSIILGTNASSRTYWSSAASGSELLAGGIPGASYNYWDTAPGNNQIDGGTGTWDTSSVFWTNYPSGSTNSTWYAGNVAHFAGTPGTVTVSGTQYITGLSFEVDGYTVTGGTQLSLNSGSFFSAPSGGKAVIVTPLEGPYNMTFSTGTVVLAGTAKSAYSATVKVTSNGTLQLGNGGTDGDINTVGQVTLDAGTKLSFNRSDTYTFTRLIAQGTAGTSTVSQDGSGITVLSNAGNAYTGPTLVNAGTLRYGAATVIPASSQITVASTGGATLDVANQSVTRSATTTIAGTLNLGDGVGGSGSMTLTTGSHSIANITGKGTLTVNSGATLTLPASFSAPNVTIVLAGGSLNLGAGASISIGTLQQSSGSAMDFGGAGNATLTVGTLTVSSGNLTASNWTAGSDHFYASAVTGSPARNTTNVAPLNQIALGGNAATQTYWASGTNELLVGAAGSYTWWDATAGNNQLDGGTGTWNTTNSNWSTSTGSFNGPWAGSTNTASFGGTAGTVTVDTTSGVPSIGGLSFSTAGYTLTGGSLALSQPATVTTPGSGTTTTVNTPLSGSSYGLSLTGGGTLVLGGANTYGGGTTISAGTLVVNGSTAAASTVTVNANTTLGGSGSASGSVNVSGTLSPGASATTGTAGTLSTGALTFTGGNSATLAMDLGASGTTGGGVNDLVQVNGDLNLNGATLSINKLAGFNPTGSYVLMTYTGTLSGTFSSNNLAAIGYLGVIQYDSTNKQVKLVSIPRVRIAQTSNGGIGTFSFVMSGLDTTSVQLTTATTGTPVTSAVYAGSIGTAVSIAQTPPLGWPSTPASISCVDASGASNGNGTGSLGSVSGSTVSLTSAQMRAGADITCTFTNANNGISGVVFNDGGAPSAGSNTGTPNDGIRNGSEQGISGATVSLTNCAGTTYASATTDGGGAYSLAVPTAQNGQGVCVVLTPPSGSASSNANYIATGANVGGTLLADGSSTSTGGTTYTYSRASRSVSFTAATNGQAAINFGEVPASTLTPTTSSRSAGQGVSAVHAHSFTAGTGGVLALSLGTGTANPSTVTGWSEIAYLDPGCTGTVQANATRLYPSGTAQVVTQGQVLCFVVQERVPAIAASGNSNAVPVTATLTLTNAAPSLTATYTATDTTTAGTTAVVLNKTVRNVTQGVSSFSTANQAKPGDVLEYRISYENTTPSPVNTLVINDATPTSTSFVSAGVETTPTQLGTCQKNTPANAAPAAAVDCAVAQTAGGTGAVSWKFSGSLPGGTSGAVLYRVQVD